MYAFWRGEGKRRCRMRQSVIHSNHPITESKHRLYEFFGFLMAELLRLAPPRELMAEILRAGSGKQRYSATNEGPKQGRDSIRELGKDGRPVHLGISCSHWIRRSEPDTAGRGSPRGDHEVRGWHPGRAARVDLIEDFEEIADDAVGACVGGG